MFQHLLQEEVPSELVSCLLSCWIEFSWPVHKAQCATRYRIAAHHVQTTWHFYIKHSSFYGNATYARGSSHRWLYSVGKLAIGRQQTKFCQTNHKLDCCSKFANLQATVYIAIRCRSSVQPVGSSTLGRLFCQTHRVIYHLVSLPTKENRQCVD